MSSSQACDTEASCSSGQCVPHIGTRDDARYTGTSRYCLPQDKRKRRPQQFDGDGTTWDTSVEQPPTSPSSHGYGVESPSMRCSPPAATFVATNHLRRRQTRNDTGVNTHEEQDSVHQAKNTVRPVGWAEKGRCITYSHFFGPTSAGDKTSDTM